MFDLSEVLESSGLAVEPCVVPLRPHTLASLIEASTSQKIVLISGPHGTGKSAYVEAAVDQLSRTGQFAQTLAANSMLVTGELEDLLTQADRDAQLLVGIDKPFALSAKALDLLDEKVRAGACTAIIECTATSTLPEQIRSLSMNVHTREITHTALAEQETFDLLRNYLGGPVVAESAYLLWYRTKGNQELVSRWTTDLRKSGELRFGTYAWYWNGLSGPSPSLFEHVSRQFEQLTEKQQRFIEHLSLAGALTRSVVARLIDDESLISLRTSGLVQISNEGGMAVMVRLGAQIWGEVLRVVILPGRRHEIFKQLAAPSYESRDDLAALSWGVAALQDGYQLSDQDLVVAAQSAYVLHRWDLLEVFVDLRFPPLIPLEDIALKLKGRDLGTQTAHTILLILRARGYLKQSNIEAAIVDLEMARTIVEQMENPSSELFRTLTNVEALVLRGRGDKLQELNELYSREIERAEKSGDLEGAHRIYIESLALPAHGADLSGQLSLISELFENPENIKTHALTVLPEYTYLLALSGQLSKAMDLVKKALGQRMFRDVNTPEADLPWIFAEAVSAHFMVGLWKGDIAEGLAVPNYEATVTLIDSAVYQTGMGRSLALLGQWDLAREQYLGALERFAVTDPVGRTKYAMAGYVQSLAATGSKVETLIALKKYDAMPYLSTAILASDCDYLVLTAAYAIGMPDFEDRLIKFLKETQRHGHWFAILKASHLGVVAFDGAKAEKYREILREAATHVEPSISHLFLADANASIEGTPAEIVTSRTELLRLGVWIPQPQVAPKLTKRQRQIAELVARGMTNREIASRLVLSVRTVDAHVASILTRTGVSDRKELSGRLKDFV